MHLGAVFSSYKYYDHLVSVSGALNDINASNLRDFAPPEKFTWARNTINHERILRMAYGDKQVLERWTRDPFFSALSFAPDHGLSAAETVEALGDREGLRDMQEEIERRIAIATIVPPKEGVKTFVTVGRLSPEKNHERLLRAFDIVHQSNPETRLVIVGEGPLMSELQRLSQDLGLAQAVSFAGQQRNPYAIMSQCDYFVLSSDYEGQPMVILEARVLGLPVVSTAFDSVRGSLPDGAGIVVPRSHEDLADGMRRALAGETGHPHFDPVTYNQEAVADFYRAIGADPA
jgi:glycosyltransferase involved in cell wall biosynthesis